MERRLEAYGHGVVAVAPTLPEVRITVVCGPKEGGGCQHSINREIGRSSLYCYSLTYRMGQSAAADVSPASPHPFRPICPFRPCRYSAS